MTPRCDGCRYWMLKPTARDVSNDELLGRHGWYPHVGGADDPGALSIGLCRRYAKIVDKAPADWCGEYVGKEGA